MKNLVAITEEKFDVIVSPRYATKNNLCGHELYAKPFCYLNKAAINPLNEAIKIAAQQNLRLKIWDCYRPFAVQKYMFDFFNGSMDAAQFISDPTNGIKTHCRGAAIDLTLVDKNNQELDMGTDLDEFSERAFQACKSISNESQKNRIKLLNIMTMAGFNFITTEWWHYQLFDPINYDIIEPEDGMVSDKVLKDLSNAI